MSSHQHPLGHGFQLALTGDLQNREEGEGFRTWVEGLKAEDRGPFFKIILCIFKELKIHMQM